MKHKIWIHQMVSALFALVLAVSSVGNLITAYDLPVGGMWKIWLWCTLIAVTVAVLFQVPHGRKMMLGLTALAIFGQCVAELSQPFLQKQITTLLYRITSHYHDVYNWPILGKRSGSDVSVPLILYAALVAFFVNWYFCRRKHIVVAIIPAVVPLVLCLLTADKEPHAVYPYLLILALAILLITDWTRKAQPDQGLKLTLWATLPIALALGLVFACNPKTNYVNYAGRIQKELSVWFEDAREVAVSVITGTPIDGSGNKRVNLQAVGSKNTSSRALMVVNSPIDGKLYLRERDYDVYTGISWEATAERKERFTSGASATSVGTLNILTYTTRSTLFVPYYATQGIEMEGGALDNKNALDQYKYVLSKKLSKKTELPSEQYMELPDETKAWATALAKEITEGSKTRQQRIRKIQAYVRDSASYDTVAVRMDSSYNDFARWFLEECETGYCIHYATAATVLLRAAGIPARYVEGYAVTCKAGTDAVVTKEMGHAWVEYYDMNTRAWCILEVTPGNEDTEKPEVIPGAPSVGTPVPGEPVDTPAEDLPVDEMLGDKPPVNLPQWDEMEEPTESDPFEEDPFEEEDPTEDVPTDPTTVPEETIATEASADDTTPGKRGLPQILRKLIIIAVGCLLVALAILVQGYVRMLRKRKLWNRGAPNALAIWRWRQTTSLANRLNQYYPEELDDLAKKARFSQHEIQPEELQKFEDYRLAIVDLIIEKPWHQRVFFKWIMAIDSK